jgi:N-methylhydantoinase A
MRVGIDIGGTFTDLCVLSDVGECRRTKLLTTSRDPSAGFLQVLRAAGVTEPAGAMREIVHATTVATNAILEGTIARMGLITTAGFRDVLEIGRHFRRDLYNFFLEKPRALVPRRLRLEVSERLDADGNVVTPLDEPQTRHAAGMLRDADVEVILICFLHSYANPSHEQRAGEIVRESCDIPVVLSHLSCAEPREYERFSTAAVNGAVVPTVVRYLRTVERRLREHKIDASLSVMQSNGGMTSAGVVAEQPALIIESGPAAGAIAVAEIGRRRGVGDLISFDMGGTTAKASLIKGGMIAVNFDYEVGGGIQGGVGIGYPLRIPVVDLVEIGTGGGSIAVVNEVGRLTVGPRSAGAEPGPACYGRGGAEATVTDANLVLGRLRADRFAGGSLTLDVAAAVEAIQQRVARPLGVSVQRAAEGIVAVANAEMVGALELISVRRGLDPAEFTMVSFGGAGPMHAAELAAELRCPRVIIPPEAGVQSAWGLLVADARRDFSRAISGGNGALYPTELSALCAELTRRGDDDMTAAGFPADAIEAYVAIDIRYAGQAYELTVRIPNPPDFSPAGSQRITDLFHEQHQRVYGHADRGGRVQWVTLRVSVIGRVPKPVPRQLRPPTHSLDSRRLATQEMFWCGQATEAPVYERDELGCGDEIVGPALIVQFDASITVPPGVRALAEASGDIVLHIRGGA